MRARSCLLPLLLLLVFLPVHAAGTIAGTAVGPAMLQRDDCASPSLVHVQHSTRPDGTVGSLRTTIHIGACATGTVQPHGTSAGVWDSLWLSCEGSAASDIRCSETISYHDQTLDAPLYAHRDLELAADGAFHLAYEARHHDGALAYRIDVVGGLAR